MPLNQDWEPLMKGSNIFWKLGSSPSTYDEADSACQQENIIKSASPGLASLVYGHDNSAWKSISGLY